MYKSIHDMVADDLLRALQQGNHYGPENAVFQIELFIRMGGNPNDHNYARLSFLTRELRGRGIAIGSSRRRGLWLDADHSPEHAVSYTLPAEVDG